MRIIIGLGNPGREYEGTAHNVGFDVVDSLCREWNISLSKKGFKSLYGEGKASGEKIMLVKPQTYMNLSGEAVVMLKKKFKDARMLVVVDDIDTEEGKVKYRLHGSGGTHNGLRNIVSFIGEDFERIKLGVGQPKGDLKNFVLAKLDKDLRANLVDAATEKVKEWVNEQNS